MKPKFQKPVDPKLVEETLSALRSRGFYFAKDGSNSARFPIEEFLDCENPPSKERLAELRQQYKWQFPEPKRPLL